MLGKPRAKHKNKELALNIEYMNRPDALRAVLNIWEKRNFILKGCNTIQYVGKHEYFHLLYSDDIANQNSKINTLIRRYKMKAESLFQKIHLWTIMSLYLIC